MDEKRCETCRHWGMDRDSGKQFRECQRIQHDTDDESWDDKRYEHATDEESVFDDPAVTIDGSGYWAALRTKCDFCCSLWEPK